MTLSDQYDAESGEYLTFASPSPPPTPTLPPVEQENLTPPPFSGYRVLITTGDNFGAGTDANVYITLYGKSGTSREILLDNPNRNDFEKGATDTFELRPDKVGNLGALEQIRIRHDNSGPLPGWYVVSVVIVDIATGHKYTFPLNRWLATDEGDGSISVVKEAVRSSKQIFTPPYSGKREWTHELGNALSKAKANESTGDIAFYIDSWAGGSTASAGQSIWVNTPQSVDLIVDGVIKYVGGPINFGFASFSELEIFWEVNEEYHSKKISSAFESTVILDKVVQLALLAAGGALAEGTAFAEERVAQGIMTADILDKLKKAQQIVDVIGTLYNLAQLVSVLRQLEQAGDLQTESLHFTFRTKPGWNKISIGLRGNTSAVVTGSAFTIVGGQVASIEVQGLP